MQVADPDWPDVQALQGGDDSGLDRLVAKHRLPLLAFVSRMIGNAGDAEVIAQETFVRAYFQIHTYRPRAPFVAWLYRIARNLCRDYFRGSAYKRWILSDGFDALPVEPAQPVMFSSASIDRIEAVQSALLKVPIKFRESLILTAIDGLSHSEAADRLGISAKAVEVRSYRARRLLAGILQSYGGI